MKMNKIIWFFVLIIYLSSCESNKTQIKSMVFNHKCQCDSISIESYNFNIEDDSTIYSVMKKEPFRFQLFIDTVCIPINSKNYYYLMAGLNVDTIGLINFSDNRYIYKKDIKEKNALLFDFNSHINDSWEINEEGYFKDYKVYLNKIKYDSSLKDTIFCFNYNYIGVKIPNGYYFVNFEISKRYGIVRYSFDNGVKCISLPKTEFLIK